MNLLDLCALAVPGPFRSDRQPAGVTLIAPAGRDAQLAGWGAALPVRAGGPLGATGVAQPATPAAARPPAGGIELCVVGAHLSGLPLNAELLGLGGTWLRNAETVPDYRLYALPGTTPPKPALVRGPPGQGFAIATEVWSLPAEAFGRFVAAIPSPLGIGTVRLADGTSPKGFLGEAAAVADAADISSFGGWRAYLAGVRA